MLRDSFSGLKLRAGIQSVMPCTDPISALGSGAVGAKLSADMVQHRRLGALRAPEVDSCARIGSRMRDMERQINNLPGFGRHLALVCL